MEKEFLIVLGTATAHCAIGMSSVFCEWVTETEKAVKVRAVTYGKGTEIEAWLPKKAMIRRKGAAPAYSLAKWYKPNDWTAKFLNLCAQTDVISA